jgi:hypothetical protein
VAFNVETLWLIFPPGDRRDAVAHLGRAVDLRGGAGLREEGGHQGQPADGHHRNLRPSIKVIKTGFLRRRRSGQKASAFCP